MLSAPHCSSTNSGLKTLTCASMAGQTASNVSSSAPAGSGNVQLGAHGRAATALLLRAGAGIERVPALVQVRDDQLRIVLERVEHAVPMVGIDIHIGDTAQPPMPAQMLDNDTAVIEYAEARGAIACRMMQSGDRHEGAPPRCGQDPLGCRKTRAHHAGRRLEYAAERRVSPASRLPVPLCERSMTKRTCSGVWNSSSSPQLALRGSSSVTRCARPRCSNSRWNAAWRSGPNGWPPPKAVASQLLAQHHRDLGALGVQSLLEPSRPAAATRPKITHRHHGDAQRRRPR